ncbi:MAG: DedA family protein [Candidatus Paceibacterota bacterium]|jgi:membrane protein DedA with SNARE-associated domain
MDSIPFVNSLITFLESSKYFLLFVGSFFEGPIVMIPAGFLWHLKVFNFWPMYFALIGGNFVADIIWYTIGYVGARPLILKFGKFFKITPEVIGEVEKKFEKYQNKVLIFSKLTMGFGFAVVILLFAGMIRVPFKKYIIINLTGSFILTIVSIFIGYLFGNIYVIVPPVFKIIFLIGIIILIIWGMKKFKNYFISEKI